jgi:hypothetical protein
MLRLGRDFNAYHHTSPFVRSSASSMVFQERTLCPMDSVFKLLTLAPPIVSPIAAIPLALLAAYVPHVVKSVILATTIGCASTSRRVAPRRDPYRHA